MQEVADGGYERKTFWSPQPLFRYVCVGCGYRQDDRPTKVP
jgi:hypothetical protein